MDSGGNKRRKLKSCASDAPTNPFGVSELVQDILYLADVPNAALVCRGWLKAWRLAREVILIKIPHPLDEWAKRLSHIASFYPNIRRVFIDFDVSGEEMILADAARCVAKNLRLPCIFPGATHCYIKFGTVKTLLTSTEDADSDNEEYRTASVVFRDHFEGIIDGLFAPTMLREFAADISSPIKDIPIAIAKLLASSRPGLKSVFVREGDPRVCECLAVWKKLRNVHRDTKLRAFDFDCPCPRPYTDRCDKMPSAHSVYDTTRPFVLNVHFAWAEPRDELLSLPTCIGCIKRELPREDDGYGLLDEEKAQYVRVDNRVAACVAQCHQLYDVPVEQARKMLFNPIDMLTMAATSWVDIDIPSFIWPFRLAPPAYKPSEMPLPVHVPLSMAHVFMQDVYLESPGVALKLWARVRAPLSRITNTYIFPGFTYSRLGAHVSNEAYDTISHTIAALVPADIPDVITCKWPISPPKLALLRNWIPSTEMDDALVAYFRQWMGVSYAQEDLILLAERIFTQPHPMHYSRSMAEQIVGLYVANRSYVAFRIAAAMLEACDDHSRREYELEVYFLCGKYLTPHFEKPPDRSDIYGWFARGCARKWSRLTIKPEQYAGLEFGIVSPGVL